MNERFWTEKNYRSKYALHAHDFFFCVRSPEHEEEDVEEEDSYLYDFQFKTQTIIAKEWIFIQIHKQGAGEEPRLEGKSFAPIHFSGRCVRASPMEKFPISILFPFAAFQFKKWFRFFGAQFVSIRFSLV